MTLREIAKKAGVSPATVSLVLNNKKGVGDITRQRILRLLQECEYAIPASTTRTSKNILFLKYIKHGLIVNENPGFIATIMDSIENECRKEGHQLSIIHAENNLDDILESIDYSLYQGLIILGTELDKQSYYALGRLKVPYIVIDNEMIHHTCNSISINNRDVMYQAVKIFSSEAIKDIAYLRSEVDIHNFHERRVGLYEGVQAFGFKRERIKEYFLDPTILGAYESMCHILDDEKKLPRHIIADNDSIALGAMKAMIEYGYIIPDDYQIIGVDDIPYAAIATPALSTIQIPKKWMGQLALKRLIEIIENESKECVKTYISGHVIKRYSTRI